MPVKSKENEEKLKRFGTLLRDARRARGWTLDAMQKMVGISAAYLSQIERGLKAPSVGNIVSLTNQYQIDPVPLIRLAHPGMEIDVLKTTSPAQEELRPSPWSFKNAINDPTFRYTRKLEGQDVEVPVEAKTFIAEVYEGIWDLHLQSPRVEEIYEEAIHDASFQSGENLANAPEPPFEVMRAIAEIYLKYRQDKARAAVAPNDQSSSQAKGKRKDK